MDTTRDIVLSVVGVVWAGVFLITMLIAWVIYYFVNKYTNKAHRLMHRKVMPMMTDIQAKAEMVRLKTEGLPGQPVPSEIAGVTGPPRIVPPMLIPRLTVFRRKRPWWQRMLPRS